MVRFHQTLRLLVATVVLLGGTGYLVLLNSIWPRKQSSLVTSKLSITNKGSSMDRMVKPVKLERGIPQNTPSSTSDQALDRELQRRLKVLDAACTRMKIPRQDRVHVYPAYFFNHMIVLDPHKVLFTFIPKVSCTSWRRLLRELMKRAGNNDRLKTLDEFGYDERKLRLETYVKVVFVREPITRLLSAWMDKFRDSPRSKKKWESYFGKKIVQRYRNGWNGGTERWLNVTFSEFARYVASLGPYGNMDAISDHWLPQSEISHPCQMGYQFIGHFENIAIEGNYLLRWLGVDHLVKFPTFHHSVAELSKDDELKNVSGDVINGLLKLYKRDYEMFGYRNDSYGRLLK